MKLNTIFYLLISLFLILISCNHKKSDSIDVNSNNKDSILLKEYLHSINFYIEKNKNDSSKFFTSKLLQLAGKKNNHYYLGKANATFGYFNLIEKKDSSAYFYLNQAKENFLKINDSINIGKSLGNMAIIQSNQGDYSGSELSSTEALNFLKNKINLDFKTSIYNCLAISSYAIKNYFESIYWYNEALEITRDSLSKSFCLNNIAVSYNYLNEHQKSDSILSILLRDSIVLNNKDLQSKVIDNLAYTKWKQDSTRNLEKEFIDALKIREEHNDDWGQIASHAHLSEYFNKKNAEKSLFHARKMYSIATELNSPDDRLEALQKLISLELPENAKKYAIQYASLNDSLVTARNRAKDQFAKIRYDTEKNREENQSLKIKDVESQLRIQRQRNTNILAISGIVILVVTVLFVYYQQKNKRKRERLIAAYESEVRMSKKVHDVVANDLHTFIIRLQNFLSSNHPEKENLIAEIENIYQSSRDISHEFQQVDKKDFNTEIKYLLSSYQSDFVKIIFNLLEDEIWEMVDDTKKVEVFRVLHEIMTNMSKHSRANIVLIEFKKEENKIQMVYRDNGIGFSQNESMKKSGIVNTENRMESIKGSIIFEPNPGKGLIITITFPV